MVPVVSLWLPILLGAVLVFVASFVMHMVLKYHWNDYVAVPKEDAVMDALRPFNITPGDYMVPRPGTMAEMKTEEYQQKLAKGPVAFFTVLPNGQGSMAGPLIQWFLFSVVIGVFAAYITGRALGPGAPYLDVFRFAATTAFMGYSLALAQVSIWYRKSWVTTLKSMFDGLIYALLTAGALGWLWPA